MTTRPILYFDLGKMFSFASEASDEEKTMMVESWGDSWKGKPVKVGKLEVGQVIDYSVDVRDGHAHCGLAIEWSNQLLDVGIYEGGSDGR